MTLRLQSRPGLLPRLLPSVVAALLWRVDPTTAAAQCDSGIIVACTLGTFGGCALILTIALLIRWTRSRRRRRALFEGDPAIRSYSKIVRGNDNLAFRDDCGAVQVRDHGLSGNSIVRQDETKTGKQAKTSKSSNEAAAVSSGALRAAPDDLTARCQQSDQPQIVNVDLVSKDIIGLGFSVQGTYSDGIYVSEVHARGPAKETGVLEVGDRLMSLTICTENMAYEDALALLSYATPYPITVRLLKRQGDLVSSHQPTTRARYRIGSSSAASVGRQIEALPKPQTLRHPAFRGRSQSVDGNLSNSCQIVPLKLPVFSAPRLVSAGASMSARTNFAVPPPKPKRSLDLGHAVGSTASGEAILSNTIATTHIASSSVSQRPPPAELAREHAILPTSAAADATAPTNGDFMRGSLTIEEPPVTHVNIEPEFTSIAVRLSPTVDNADIMAATESSLLEDINRFLSHERQAEAIGRAAADRDAAAAPFDRASPTSEGVRDENDFPENFDYWQDEDGVRPVLAPMTHARPAGITPPASTICTLTNGVDGESSQKEISADVFESYEVVHRIGSPTGRSSLNSLDSLTAGVLNHISEQQVFRSPDLPLRNVSCIPSSNCPPSPTMDDSDAENDERTSTPSASRVASHSSRTLLTVNDVGAVAHVTEMSVDADSTAAHSLWQPSSWSALLNITANSADVMAAETTSQPADGPQREIRATLASDDHRTQQNGLAIRAIRQTAATEATREAALDETQLDNVNLLRLHSTGSLSEEEASPLYWVLDENHLAKRSISNMTVLSSDSAPKSSDISGAASRSSMRGSDDDATPQPLRKFGNFANLSNDELDADGGNLFNHMADRDSISSESSTPITSDQDEEPSPPRQHPAFNGVDENLNQAPKIAGMPDNDLSPRAHDVSGTRKTIEEARAQFFAEMLQRGTH